MQNKKYFTDMNTRIIYGRLENELGLNILEQPVLERWDYGYKNVCLEEDQDKYKFYIVDDSNKLEYEEFNDIKIAIERLIIHYKDKKYCELDENEIINRTNTMREIFYQTLGLFIPRLENDSPKVLKYSNESNKL